MKCDKGLSRMESAWSCQRLPWVARWQRQLDYCLMRRVSRVNQRDAEGTPPRLPASMSGTTSKKWRSPADQWRSATGMSVPRRSRGAAGVGAAAAALACPGRLHCKRAWRNGAARLAEKPGSQRREGIVRKQCCIPGRGWAQDRVAHANGSAARSTRVLGSQCGVPVHLQWRCTAPWRCC